MRVRTVLIYSIATVAVGLVSPGVTPFLTMPTVAQAETNVSISIGTFYNDLAPYGSWVSYQDSYVFVPSRVALDWRPYTEGHWVHTRRYGWMWVSDEEFGWATYHYGRWGYAEDFGWYWVPGRRWAPAWVAWRRSGDYVVWAPLPPGRGGDIDIEISINDVPEDYWVAVPSRNFLDADLSVAVIDDDTERVRIIEAAKPVGVVSIENNIVVNNVIDVDYVEKTTDKKVKNVEVTQTDDPKQAGKESGGEIAAFTGEVKEEKNAKPPKVKDVEEVKKEKADSGQQGEDQQQSQDQTTKKKAKASGESAQPEEGQAQQEPEQTIKKKKAKASGESAQPEEGQAQQEPEQTIKKKKAKASSESAQPEEGQAQQEPEQTIKKKKKAKASAESAQPKGQAQQEPAQTIKKKKAKASTESAQPKGQAEVEQEQTIKKKKARASGQPAQPEEGQAAQGQAKQKKQKGSEEQPQQKGCDPQTGQNC